MKFLRGCYEVTSEINRPVGVDFRQKMHSYPSHHEILVFAENIEAEQVVFVLFEHNLSATYFGGLATHVRNDAPSNLANSKSGTDQSRDATARGAFGPRVLGEEFVMLLTEHEFPQKAFCELNDMREAGLLPWACTD